MKNKKKVFCIIKIVILYYYVIKYNSLLFIYLLLTFFDFMEGKPPTLLSDEDKIFYLLFQYHHHSFNKTIWSNNAIYKIKQKIKEYFQNSQKSQRKKFAQSANKDIIIVTKENKKAIETEQPKEEPKPSQEEKPKEELIQPKKQKTFIVLGGIYNDIIEALKKEGWLELENKEE